MPRHDKPTTEELAKKWNKARQYIDTKRAELAAAVLEEKLAANELGERIAPSDIKRDEPIGVWLRIDEFSEKLVIVCLPGDAQLVGDPMKFRVTVRE